MNDDLISRQAAIEAIEKNAYRHTYLDQIISILERMPTAKPEVIRCKDCKLWLPPHGCNDTAGLIYTTANAFCSFAERRNDG